MNTQILQHLVVLLAIKEQLTENLKQVNKHLQTLEPTVHDELISSNCLNFKLIGDPKRGWFTDGEPRILTPELEPKPNVVEENLQEFHKWLRANGHGALIKETVHYQTLKGWVIAQREANQPIPEMVKVFDLKTVKVTKPRAPQKGRKGAVA